MDRTEYLNKCKGENIMDSFENYSYTKVDRTLPPHFKTVQEQVKEAEEKIAKIQCELDITRAILSHAKRWIDSQRRLS